MGKVTVYLLSTILFLGQNVTNSIFSLAEHAVGFISQTNVTPGTDWLGVLAAYGVAAPFALLCLYFIKELRSENKELRDRLVDSFIPALTLSNKLHTDTAKVLNEATQLVHTLSAAPVPDIKEINRATFALGAMTDRAETLERELRRR